MKERIFFILKKEQNEDILEQRLHVLFHGKVFKDKGFYLETTSLFSDKELRQVKNLVTSGLIQSYHKILFFSEEDIQRMNYNLNLIQKQKPRKKKKGK
jgi:hypothetical protein